MSDIVLIFLGKATLSDVSTTTIFRKRRILTQRYLTNLRKALDTRTFRRLNFDYGTLTEQRAIGNYSDVGKTVQVIRKHATDSGTINA
jgi:hypothetical protein